VIIHGSFRLPALVIQSLREHCPPGSQVRGTRYGTQERSGRVCFWDTLLELVRILRPGGLLDVNAPSNSEFHRDPVDCWGFYPDAGLMPG
jgi:hypothetical protein